MLQLKFPSWKVPFLAQQPVPESPVSLHRRRWLDQLYMVKAGSEKHLCEPLNLHLLISVVGRGTNGQRQIEYALHTNMSLQ